jgi:hypothetical protein
MQSLISVPKTKWLNFLFNISENACTTLYPPRSITDMFGNCLIGVDPRFKILIRVGAIVVIWYVAMAM